MGDVVEGENGWLFIVFFLENVSMCLLLLIVLGLLIDYLGLD